MELDWTVVRSLYVAVPLVLLVALILGTGCLRYYRWESRKENPGRADVLIVPGIRLTDEGKGTFILHNRVAMAKHLLDEGFAPRLILTGGNPQSGINEAQKMKQIALKLGVKEDQIATEPRATSSVDNARYSAELMTKAGYRSALVVTDAPHLGYAIPVFRDAFAASHLTLYWLPVDYNLLSRLGTARHPKDPPE